MTGVRVIEQWLDWESTGATLEAGGQQESLSLPGISQDMRDTCVAEVSRLFGQGHTLMVAVEKTLQTLDVSALPRKTDLPSDVFLVDATDVTEASRAVDIVKSVSALARGTRSVVLVAGALDFGGSSDYDNLSAFGALMVRLNIAQVYAVGQGARGLFLSVGMEGSWDGESQFCADASTAYDDIRARIQPGDVLLILGSTEESLSPLVHRVREGLG